MSYKNVKRSGYKKTKVGWIPEYWEVHQLDSLCKVSGEYGAAVSAIEYSEELPRYIRITDINDFGVLHQNGKKSISIEDAEGYFLEADDFLFARSGATVGKSYLYQEKDGEAAFAGYLIRFKPDPEKLVPAFLSNFTHSARYWNWVSSIVRAGAQPNINAKEYASLLLPVPPLPEQRKIAEILGTWDRAIELVGRQIEAKQRLKKALMQQLLTGKKRFPGFGDGISKDSTPVGWHRLPLGKVGRVFSGGTPSTNNPDYWNGDLVWITPSEVTVLDDIYVSKSKRKITDEGLKNSSAELLPAGSVVVCTRASIGDTAICTIPLCTNQGFKSISPSINHNSEFIYFSLLFNRKLLYQLANGSTFLEVSGKDFRKITMIYPELSEQKQISEVLLTCYKEIKFLSKKRDYIRKQKQGLMQKLLTGEERVNV